MPKTIKRTRDAQINRVRAAEDEVITACDKQLVRFVGRWEAQDWLAKVGRTRFIKRYYPEFRHPQYEHQTGPYVAVHARRRYPTINSDSDSIILPKNYYKYLNDFALLHYAAHLIIKKRDGKYDHSRDWAYVFAALVKRFCAKEVYDQLVASYRTHRVKFRKTRAKTNSTEGREGNTSALVRYRQKQKESNAFAELAQLLNSGAGSK